MNAAEIAAMDRERAMEVVRTVSAARCQFEDGWDLMTIFSSFEEKLAPLFVIADMVMDGGTAAPNAAQPFDVDFALWIAEIERELQALGEVVNAVQLDPTRVKGGDR